MDTMVVDILPQLVAVVRRTVTFAELPAAQREARKTLNAALQAAKVAGGRTLTVWRPPVDGMIDYAPGTFVPTEFEAPAAVTFLTLPAGEAARLVHSGPYDGLPQAWGRLFADCKTLAREPTGPFWELYSTEGSPPEAELFAGLSQGG